MKHSEKKEKLGKLLDLEQNLENGASWSFLELRELVHKILIQEFHYTSLEIEKKENEAYENLGYRNYRNRFKYLEEIYKQAVPGNCLVEVADLPSIRDAIFAADGQFRLIGTWVPIERKEEIPRLAQEGITIITHKEKKEWTKLAWLDHHLLHAIDYISGDYTYPYYYIVTGKEVSYNGFEFGEVVCEVELRDDYK